MPSDGKSLFPPIILTRLNLNQNQFVFVFNADRLLHEADVLLLREIGERGASAP